MSDEEPDEEKITKTSSKMPLILGFALALVGGGGGFYAAWSGMILHPKDEVTAETKAMPDSPNLEISYVAVDPLVISLGGATDVKHLKFRAQLEVPADAKAEVSKVLPRVVDVLNSYLRALQPSDLQDPSALARLRSQMLRRVQVVTGADRVNDLLIMEFVLT